MKLTTWSVINNEIDFIKITLPLHLQWADNLYFLDTGSTDGTLQFLQEQAFQNHKIIVEKYHTSYVPDYSRAWEEIDPKNQFPETEIRNYAISQAEKTNCNYLCQIDGDEYMTNPKPILEKYNYPIVLSHSTINPVCALKDHPIEYRNRITLYDPHSRIWANNQGFNYFKNPAFKGEKEYHCIPGFETFNIGGIDIKATIKSENSGRDVGTKIHIWKHLYHHPGNIFIDDKPLFHLHWIFGKKLESFYQNKGISSKEEIIKQQKLNEFSGLLPKIFWDKRKEWLNS